jgi:hypothetical protein
MKVGMKSLLGLTTLFAFGLQRRRDAPSLNKENVEIEKYNYKSGSWGYVPYFPGKQIIKRHFNKK